MRSTRVIQPQRLRKLSREGRFQVAFFVDHRFGFLELVAERDLGLLDAIDERFKLDDRLGASPHQHPVDVPVAPVEGTVLQEIDRLPQNQRAVDEAAIEERLAADVNGLVLKSYLLMLGQEHDATIFDGGANVYRDKATIIYVPKELVMKWIRRVIMLVVLLVILVGVVVYLKLGSIIRSTVESQANSSLNLKTTLGGATISLLGGKVGLQQLAVGSPDGFSAPHMFEVSDASVAVNYSQLRSQPIHVQAITITGPKLVIEQKDGVLNFKKAMDQMPPSQPSTPAPKSSSEPMKLIIDDLMVKDAQVTIHPNLPGMSDITVPVALLDMKNIGNGDGAGNGAAVKDVVMQVVTALAGSASSAGGIPDQLKGMLNANVGQVASQLGAEAQKTIGSVVPGGLSGAIKDPKSLIKDPGQALQGLLGGKK